MTLFAFDAENKVFEPLAKHDLVLGGVTLVGKHRRQTVLVVGHQVYTHLKRDFGPLLFADPLQILKVAFSMGGNEVHGQYSTVHGPIHSPLDAVESSCTLGRETAPKHNVSTSMTVGMVLLGSYSAFFPLQTRQVELMPKSLILVSSDHIMFSQSSLESFKCSLA